MTHLLKLGDLVLHAGDGSSTQETFALSAYASDADFGRPEESYSESRSPLDDGAHLTPLSADNRELHFRIEIESLTGTERGLSDGEAALLAATGRRSELTRRSGLVDAVETIWDVEWSAADWQYDDLDEERQLIRVYGLTLTCYPWGRATEPVLIPAIGSGGTTTPTTPTVTTVWDGTTTTGWSASPAPLTTAGATVSTSPATADGVAALIRTGTVSMSGTPWLSIRAGGLVTSVPHLILPGGNIKAPTISTGDYWHHWYLPSISSLSEIRLIAGTLRGGVLWASRITRQDVMPWADTGRQVMQAFTIHGTARTQGSIHIGHASQGLGMTLVHCQADDGSGALPPLRRHRVTGGSAPATVGDSTAISGQRTVLTSGVGETFRVPASQVAPGLYMLVTRLWSDTAQTRTVTQATSTRHSGADVSIGYAQRQVTLAAGAWTWVDLHPATLPTNPLPTGSSAEVSIAVSVDGSVGLDDLWLMNVSTGSVVRVDAGAFKHLWIDTPTLDNPRPAIWVGATADKTQARHVEMSKVHTWDVTRWEPGRENVFTASSAEGPAVDAAYWRRFRHNAAPIPEEVMP